MEIKEKTIEDQKVAIMNYKGSLNDMEVLIGKLSGWLEVEEIETAGKLFAIFYNNPRTAKPGSGYSAARCFFVCSRRGWGVSRKDYSGCFRRPSAICSLTQS